MAIAAPGNMTDTTATAAKRTPAAPVARTRVAVAGATGYAGQELVRLPLLAERLQLVGKVEDRLQLLGVPASDSREVPALQVLGDLDHRSGC